MWPNEGTKDARGLSSPWPIRANFTHNSYLARGDLMVSDANIVDCLYSGAIAQGVRRSVHRHCRAGVGVLPSSFARSSLAAGCRLQAAGCRLQADAQDSTDVGTCGRRDRGNYMHMNQGLAPIKTLARARLPPVPIPGPAPCPVSPSISIRLLGLICSMERPSSATEMTFRRNSWLIDRLTTTTWSLGFRMPLALAMAIASSMSVSPLDEDGVARTGTRPYVSSVCLAVEAPSRVHFMPSFFRNGTTRVRIG
mmetsp:Transcript_15658/g.44648  ORF Transcript_15658/g.44648 Transcript_15658/m.44648 type:complete len:252 (+) Transcript_15658:1024-1779(+)